jgi:tetratricopeptide (TPR) repeat protein
VNIENRIALNKQTRKIQPYSVSDGEYVTLVEFSLEAARLLDRSYRPTFVWSEKTTERFPNESEITRFNLGEKPAVIEIIHRKAYEPGVDVHAEDDISLVCNGLPEDVILKLHVLRRHPNPRFIEMCVSGPQTEVEAIVEEFENRFRNEHIPEEKQLEYFLRTAKAASAVHAWRAAELNAQQVFKHDSNNPAALMYLGIAKAAQGYEPEGENQLLASLTLDPKNAEAYYNLGLIVMEQARCIFASEAFKKGLTIDSTNHSLLYRLGQALERLGNLNEAIETYHRALDHRPNPKERWVPIESDFTEETKESIRRVQSAIRNSQSHSDLECAD